jgi:hypothetical protein
MAQIKVAQLSRGLAPQGFPQKEVFLLCKNRKNPPLQIQSLRSRLSRGILRCRGSRRLGRKREAPKLGDIERNRQCLRG